MTSNEIRDSFLKYFERKRHRIVRSASLVPHDDPTLLFTNAGMNQFKDLFLGKERRDYKRATTSQKCMRVSGKHNDLDNVGPSLRHHTFFEMLGNFSFGDYFKEEAIGFAWELLTDVWNIPPEKLHATVFSGEGGIPRDDEARQHWLRFLPAERITELGLADNFWQMGETGPCGRCSEIHFFRGQDLPCTEPVCKGVACSCDRYVEIWNNVFMEFDRQAGGQLGPLPAPSIDTGMGLERITAVLQGVVSNYDTDLFTPLLGAVGELAGRAYGRLTAPSDVSFRVVADHLRAMTFLIADGVLPSNEWRGYVLRKIMRRAMRHGMRLGMTEPFLYRLVEVLVAEMGAAYPELAANRETLQRVIRTEEERFITVLAEGLPRLEEGLDRAAASRTALPGDEAFRLYDTFGLPFDFIDDLAGERQIAVDRPGFDRAMEAQRDKARARSAFDGQKAQDFSFDSDETRDALHASGDRFEGYGTTSINGLPILALFDENRRQVKELRAPTGGYVALERTPFYLEAGGQVSDVGHLLAPGARAAVQGVTRVSSGWPRFHRVQVIEGALRERDLVTAEVDRETRDATRRNHTATHLLHAALRTVLGTHVKQAGSLVAPDRLRFDFVHHAPVSPDQIREIERIVNEHIVRNLPVMTEERSTQEAIAAGAMALFGEKYGDTVRVVSVPGFSMELCGGTHCGATGDIGFFAIVAESGVAAGVRRIEALTGAAAVAVHQRLRGTLDEVLGVLSTTADRARPAIELLQTEAKRLAREVSKLKVERARGQGGQSSDAVEEIRISEATFVSQRAENLEKAELRQLADEHRNRIKSGAVVISSVAGDKVSLVVAVTKDLAPRVHAGQIVKQIAPLIGGSGGGRPDFAEAGGSDRSRIPEAVSEARRLIEAILSR